jgi:hypothetical protein
VVGDAGPHSCGIDQSSTISFLALTLELAVVTPAGSSLAIAVAGASEWRDRWAIEWHDRWTYVATRAGMAGPQRGWREWWCWL